MSAVTNQPVAAKLSSAPRMVKTSKGTVRYIFRRMEDMIDGLKTDTFKIRVEEVQSKGGRFFYNFHGKLDDNAWGDVHIALRNRSFEKSEFKKDKKLVYSLVNVPEGCPDFERRRAKFDSVQAWSELNEFFHRHLAGIRQRHHPGAADLFHTTNEIRMDFPKGQKRNRVTVKTNDEGDNEAVEENEETEWDLKAFMTRVGRPIIKLALPWCMFNEKDNECKLGLKCRLLAGEKYLTEEQQQLENDTNNKKRKSEDGDTGVKRVCIEPIAPSIRGCVSIEDALDQDLDEEI